jgi:hypothetical protein
MIWASVAILCVSTIAFWSRFRYASICTTSGEMQQTTLWQIPKTDITYWRSASVIETPLSKVIAENHLGRNSLHAWLFASGGGNGILCSIGDGRHLYTAVLSTGVATFVAAETKYRDHDEARHWVDLLLDPKTSNGVAGIIRMSDVPASGFHNKQDFEQWRLEHRETFDIGMEIWGGGSEPSAFSR